LFELAGASWLGEVDWGHWRDSAQGLDATHPTDLSALDQSLFRVPRQPGPGEPRTGPDRGLPEDLALVRKVSASTQNLALNALVFLYREVLRREDLVKRSAPRAAE
jgi:hypothetical protein